MKLLFTTLAVFTVFTLVSADNAEAHRRRRRIIAIGLRCSPEAQNNSAAAVQSIISEEAASPRFANAQQFQQFSRDTAALPNTEARIAAYFQAVGVDANDQDQVLEFVGAREHSRYVTAAEQNLGLNTDQSAHLVERMNNALLRLLETQPSQCPKMLF